MVLRDAQNPYIVLVHVRLELNYGLVVSEDWSEDQVLLHQLVTVHH